MPLTSLLFDASEPEHSQARVRLLLVSLVLGLLLVVLLLDSKLPRAAYWRVAEITVGYWLFSILWLPLAKHARGGQRTRRGFVLFTDLATVSVAMHAAGPLGTFLYPIYLWIIAGYGIRYGIRCLITAVGAGAVAFALVLIATPYWQERLLDGAGLLVGLIVVPAYLLVLLRELYRVNERLSRELEHSVHTASHDALTGLANRSWFFQQLETEIARARRYQIRFAVLFIDLDGFKRINDTLGHRAGDGVLSQLGQRLRMFCRKSDLAARIGGDEFALILGDVSDDASAQDAAQRIAELFNQPFSVDSSILKLSASIGISFYPTHGSVADELVHHADLAMYEIKRKQAGGNTVRFPH
ncbi:MAG: GGDEF domain-containing protein [Gammaproteobacteria bacterium]